MKSKRARKPGPFRVNGVVLAEGFLWHSRHGPVRRVRLSREMGCATLTAAVAARLAKWLDRAAAWVKEGE